MKIVLLLSFLAVNSDAVTLTNTGGDGGGGGISQSAADDRYLNTGSSDTISSQASLTVYSSATFLSSVTASHIDAQSSNFTRSMTASTASIFGNAFSVGTSTFVIVGSSIGIRTANPFAALAISSGYIHVDGPSSLGIHIGTYAPTANAQLSIQRAGSGSILLKAESGNPSNSVQLFGPGAGVPLYIMDRADGNIATPLITGANSTIGEIWWRSHDGGSSRATAKIQAVLEAGSSATSLPTQFRFLTAPYTTVAAVQRMVITSSGTVGINTTDPQAMLHVAGASLFQGSMTITAGSFTVAGQNAEFSSSTVLLTGNASRPLQIGTTFVFLSSGAAGFGTLTPACPVQAGTGGASIGSGGADLCINKDAGNPRFAIANLNNSAEATFRISDGVTGIGSQTSQPFTFLAGGSVRGAISTTGNWKIGINGVPEVTTTWGNAGASLHVASGNANGKAIYTDGAASVVSLHLADSGNKNLQLSTGTVIANIMKSSFTFDFPSVPAAGTISFGYSTTGISGGGDVASGDVCWVEAPALEDDLSVSFSSATTASAVISLRFNNPSAGAIDPALQIFRYGCMRSLN